MAAAPGGKKLVLPSNGEQTPHRDRLKSAGEVPPSPLLVSSQGRYGSVGV